MSEIYPETPAALVSPDLACTRCAGEDAPARKLAIALDALRDIQDEPHVGYGPVRATTALRRIAALGPSLGEVLDGDEGEAGDPFGPAPFLPLTPEEAAPDAEGDDGRTVAL